MDSGRRLGMEIGVERSRVPLSYPIMKSLTAGSGRGCRVVALMALALVLQASAWCSVPETVRVVSGELEAGFRRDANGIVVESIRDTRSQQVLASGGAPFFTLVVRKAGATEERTLTSTAGWDLASIEPTSSGIKLMWAKPSQDPALAGLIVRVVGVRDGQHSGLRWSLHVEANGADVAVRRVVFPQLDLADLGADGTVLFPRGPGELQRGVWSRDFHYRGTYPDGWCCMQFMASYREGQAPCGLYVAAQDPWGSTKYLELKSTAGSHTARLSMELPAAGMNKAGNGFETSGEVVWQLFRGDWYDAARIYREWAQREARWWPRMSSEGRSDTPLWMRELCAWAMTGGAPGDCQDAVTTFRNAIGLPIGFHWYNWHQIPFDNDYPHYFPTKPGFAEAVAKLQSAGVHVMPYINGRLWDSHDRGSEDFEFTRVALPAVTKREDGQPFIESYGSKETNGEPVRLGVMCPTTSLWRSRVRDIVLGLQKGEGTDGVYIDQIAAAAPTLCMDPGHGHPLGGGHWWTPGYWGLLDAIRRDMPPGRMITTECNGEAYIRWFDGYLTWHWQFDGQVPAFPSVYGGTVQMFGRAYRAGATKDLALHMKAGQQLVFGEQIGWFDPVQATEPQNIAFLRKAIHARWEHRRFFYAGEMARPPRLTGTVSKVKADWQWSGEWMVTTDAVLTGAWRLPGEKRLLVLLANVSGATEKAVVHVDLAECGFAGKGKLKRVAILDCGMPQEDTIGAGTLDAGAAVELAPESVLAWEISPSR